MTAMNMNSDKQWYCIETVDETLGVHSILCTFNTEREATALLQEADQRMPPSVHIYYWIAGTRPVSLPPLGYKGGPMARPDGPITD